MSPLESQHVLIQLADIEDPQAALTKALSLTRRTAGADLIVVLKCLSSLTVQCVHHDPPDPVCDLLTMGSVCERALEEDKPEFIEDYRSQAYANKILTSWGAVSVAILPIHSGVFTGVVLLAWKQPVHLRTALQHFLLSMLSYFRSVLPHQELSKQLKVTQDRLSSILKNIPQGVVFVDTDELDAWINAPASRMLHLPPGNVPPLQVSNAMRDLRKRTDAGKHSNEQVIEISSSGLSEDSMAGQLWVLHDVTTSFHQSRQLHEKTQALTCLNDQLQTAKQLLEEKVAERTMELAEAVRQLQARNEDLHRSEERLRLAVDATCLGIWDVDVSTGKLEWNQHCRAAFGVSPHVDLMLDDFVAALHPEDRECVQKAMQQALDPEGNGAYSINYRSIGVTDQILRHIHAEGLALFEGTGSDRRAVRFLGTVQDITASERAKDALLRANSDLQQFAYAAAHDLQEPLRNIATSMGLLKREIKDQLTAVPAELIEEGIEGAQRMHRMVKDLLSFTKIVDWQTTRNASVNAQIALEQALKNLSVSIAEAEANVIYRSLPEVEMEEVHLMQIFQNLIGNSLKYRRPDVLLQIQVSAEGYPGEWRFTVADNGIGFDPVYAQRIFGVFKRLHGRHEYPGNGIGLAICSRIVASYGGRIWAEGQVSAGSRFFFTIPISQRGRNK